MRKGGGPGPGDLRKAGIKGAKGERKVGSKWDFNLLTFPRTVAETLQDPWSADS